MIVLDANLLIYSYNRGSAHHANARAWLERTFSGTEMVGLPWQTVSAFLRVMTNQRLPGATLYRGRSSGNRRSLADASHCAGAHAGDEHWRLLRRMVIEGRASGPLVSDAEIATLTVEYGGVLHTADRDFARFPGLRWVNPLQG